MRESSTQAAAGKEALEKQVGAPVPWLALHEVQLALRLCSGLVPVLSNLPKPVARSFPLQA